MPPALWGGRAVNTLLGHFWDPVLWYTIDAVSDNRLIVSCCLQFLEVCNAQQMYEVVLGAWCLGAPQSGRLPLLHSPQPLESFPVDLSHYLWLVALCMLPFPAALNKNIDVMSYHICLQVHMPITYAYHIYRMPTYTCHVLYLAMHITTVCLD